MNPSVVFLLEELVVDEEFAVYDNKPEHVFDEEAFFDEEACLRRGAGLRRAALPRLRPCCCCALTHEHGAQRHQLGRAQHLFDKMSKRRHRRLRLRHINGGPRLRPGALPR
jgi:hypothetical protein